MSMTRPHLPWFVYLMSFLVTLIVLPDCRADDRIFQSRFCIVHYSDGDQLEIFARKIRAGALTRTLNQILVGKGGASSNQSELGEFLDGLLKRVQLVLDMPMPNLRVEIQVHRDVKEVGAAFRQLTGQSSEALAFYWKKSNTIHIQTEKLTVGMLAHEMGHAILDHYFAIQPPEKIAEMLCQYVDKEITAGNF